MSLSVNYGISVNEMINRIEIENYFNELDHKTDKFIKENINQELKNEFLEISRCLTQFDMNLIVEQVAAIGIEMYKQKNNLRSFKIDRYESIEKLLEYELRQFKTNRKNKHGKIIYNAYPVLLNTICGIK